ncbi:thioesterase family protein [Nocardioides sp. zg-ZUI104]|uniref:acyl-CoA thioesterase n=1 Tax=Nocardioides faecalis TaxID=2803858 RepID=UPI001BCA6FF5|nr:thioesterase family protein [Nocardioides faecalis]MBS4753641.1 thioesterase family protein [Nocardioides faecalis]
MTSAATTPGARSEFDRDTAVAPAEDGSLTAELSEKWGVGPGLNGGYQLAVVGNAIRAALPAQPDPLVLSAYFLSPAAPGPATVDVTPRRMGRTATVAADLRQGDDVRLTVLATYGDLDTESGDVHTTALPPSLAPLEECVPNTQAPAELRSLVTVMERFDMRFDPACAGWFAGQPSGRGEMAAWFRFADGREPDPVSLLLVLDALPPVTFDLGRPGWAPTMELTAHVRAKPAPGWLRVRHVTRNAAGHLFEEDCEIWDSADRLVAQSRQLARLPR